MISQDSFQISSLFVSLFQFGGWLLFCIAYCIRYFLSCEVSLGWGLCCLSVWKRLYVKRRKFWYRTTLSWKIFLLGDGGCCISGSHWAGKWHWAATVKPSVVSCRDTPAGLLAVPTCLNGVSQTWSLQKERVFEALTGMFIASIQSSRQALGAATQFSVTCVSISRGDSSCLGPGGLLSPCPHAWVGISSLQRFQTVTSSPGIMSLLEIRWILQNLEIFLLPSQRWF